MNIKRGGYQFFVKVYSPLEDAEECPRPQQAPCPPFNHNVSMLLIPMQSKAVANLVPNCQMLSRKKAYSTVYKFYHLSHTEPSILSAIANISRSDHVDSSSNTRIVHTGYHLGGFLISDVHKSCQIYRFSAFLQPGEDLLEASNMGVDGHRFSSNVHLLLRKAITLPLFIFILINYCRAL